jgi:hypothetical protein
MKKIIYSFLFAVCLLVIASCNKSVEYTTDESSIKANTDLSFELYGYQSVKLISLFDKHEYELNIVTDKEQNVSIEVDENLLSDYNRLYNDDLKILPPDYYSFTSEQTLSSESTDIPVTFNTGKMVSELSESDISTYVLPLIISPASDTIIVNESMCKTLLHVTIEEATVLLEEPAKKEFVDTSSTEIVSFAGYYNFDRVDASKLNIEVDADAVDTYNSENGTQYLSLPETAYSYRGISIDSVNAKITFDFEVNAKALEDTVYVLPITVNSSLYDIKPEATTIYELVSVYNTAPQFLQTYELTAYQNIDNNYTTTPVEFDLAEAAGLFGITEDKLKENIRLYALNSNQSLTKDYNTQAKGFWFNSTGDVVNWGTDGCTLMAEYAEDGKFLVGQFPGATSDWDSYTVGMVLVYNGEYIRYNITLNIIPEYTDTYDLAVSETVDENYATTQVTFDFAATATALGVSENDLRSGISFYGINADGSLVTTGYTANTGYWYDKNGDVCNWGADDCVLFVEYEADGKFNVGQFPGSTASGDSYSVAMVLKYEESLIKINVTLNID